MRAPIAVLAGALFVGHSASPAPPEASGEAAQLLAAARGVSPVICTLAATPLAEERFGYQGMPLPDGPVAATVYWALRPHYESRDIATLTAGVRDADPCVRSLAARLLAGAGPAGTSALLEALGAAEPVARRVAAEGLGFAEYHAAAPALTRALRDSDADVRGAAAWALGRMEAIQAEAALGDALDDPAIHVRLAAIDAFAHMELDDAVELLLPLLDDAEPRIRVATARALGDILD